MTLREVVLYFLSQLRHVKLPRESMHGHCQEIVTYEFYLNSQWKEASES